MNTRTNIRAGSKIVKDKDGNYIELADPLDLEP